MDAHLANLQAEYERIRAAALRAQNRLATLTASATSPDGLVTAVVSGRGELCRLEFGTRRYRDLPPAELAHAIVETVALARRAVLSQLTADLPIGPSTVDLMRVDVDLGRLLPDVTNNGRS